MMLGEVHAAPDQRSHHRGKHHERSSLVSAATTGTSILTARRRGEGERQHDTRQGAREGIREKHRGVGDGDPSPISNSAERRSEKQRIASGLAFLKIWLPKLVGLIFIYLFFFDKNTKTKYMEV